MQVNRGGGRAKGRIETMTPGPKNMIREVRREGGCSSRRLRCWWIWTINYHGFEISIAGCVREMVRDPNLMPFFSFLFFFSFFLSCVLY